MRRSSAFPIAAAIAIAIATSPAISFPTTGARSDVAARQAMQDYADCLVDRSPAAAARLLALDPTDRRTRATLSDYARNERGCLHSGTSIGMDYQLLAGAMAERMLARRPDRAGLADTLRYDPSQAPVVARTAIEVIGLCVARKAPDQSVGLFATKPASAAEQEAIAGLVPVFAGCVPTGQQMVMTPVALRSDVARGAYMIAAQNDRTALAVARK